MGTTADTLLQILTAAIHEPQMVTAGNHNGKWAAEKDCKWGRCGATTANGDRRETRTANGDGAEQELQMGTVRSHNCKWGPPGSHKCKWEPPQNKNCKWRRREFTTQRATPWGSNW
jgi:hypothetical protein